MKKNLIEIIYQTYEAGPFTSDIVNLLGLDDNAPNTTSDMVGSIQLFWFQKKEGKSATS